MNVPGPAAGGDPALPCVDAGRFKAVMRDFTAAVTVITCAGDGSRGNGMTATAVCSVSADPPCVLVVVNRGNRSHALIDASGRYAVNVLAPGQEALARHFASRPDDPFAGVAHRAGATGCPLIEDCAAFLECEVCGRFEAGSHTIFVGRVVAADVRGRGPLLYRDGRFLQAA